MSALRLRHSTQQGVLFVVVAAGYYLGGLVGLELRLPPATTAMLWPPNAVLTVALLATPFRSWPICLAGALAAHLTVQLPTDRPLSLIAALYFTNCSEALIAAACLRRTENGLPRFDSLRRLARFLVVAAVFAPLCAAFLDAAAVSWLRGESYWLVWRNRLASGILAQLVIVPAGVGLIDVIRSRAGMAKARRVEAGALTLIAAATMLPPLWGLADQSILSALSLDSPMLLQLPLLLWAAARFGATGTSLTVLATTCVSAWAAAHGHPPFTTLRDPQSTIFAMQLFLIVIALTLLSFTAIIEERRGTERMLARRLEFEALLSRLSGAFVFVPSDRMGAAFEEWLSRVGHALAIDCIRLMELSAGRLDILCTWAAPGVKAPNVLVNRDYPWGTARLMRGETVIVERADDVPAIATTDRASLSTTEFRSVLILPLAVGGEVIGALSFGSCTPKSWTAPLIDNLTLLAEVFANALARKRTEDALRASESMKASILDSLSSGLAVIDPHGNLRAVNHKWTEMLRESEGHDYPLVHVGDNLFKSFGAPEHGERHSRSEEVVNGIRALLDGRRERFVFEHGRQTTYGERWWVLLATRLRGPEGGAVLTFTDITERRRAEAAAQESRDELAHFTRVATMGEMAVSLAHQLNQPLAAIMANANAARKLLDDTPHDVAELHEILRDIAADDRRASEVIQRLRDLLKKNGAARERVDLNAAIREVAVLVRSDAVIRNVSVSLHLEDRPLYVTGDRVQLQQAALNLIINAVDAVCQQSGRHRLVSVVSSAGPERMARVTFRDTGPGISPELEESIFEPFYTTKENGMGMGLSIARSIVDSHGGTIKVKSRSAPGAVIELTLPLERQGES